jgi:hypothetical protein
MWQQSVSERWDMGFGRSIKSWILSYMRKDISKGVCFSYIHFRLSSFVRERLNHYLRQVKNRIR